jgi:hypothetical protein
VKREEELLQKDVLKGEHHYVWNMEGCVQVKSHQGKDEFEVGR